MTLKRIVLMPHPPIAIPEVAKERFEDVKITADGMKTLSGELININPDTIIIITPHSKGDRQAFCAYVEPVLNGQFGMFGAPQVKIQTETDLELLGEIAKVHHHKGFRNIIQIEHTTPIDHGSGVPLYYLLKSGFKGKVIIFNYSFSSIEDHLEFGKSLATASELSSKKIILLASGDLSHRIIQSAPAGYHPDGKIFDELIIKAVTNGNYSEITDMKQTLRHNAGECAYNSLIVAIGASSERQPDNKIYSYEAPFGVGYLVASL